MRGSRYHNELYKGDLAGTEFDFARSHLWLAPYASKADRLEALKKKLKNPGLARGAT
jgi:hypothetical protein